MSEPDPLASFDISPLERAVVRVARSLHYVASDLAESDAEIKDEFRQSAIQAFEYTFELAIKTLERFLKASRPIGMPIRPTYNELIRAGIADGLIAGELSNWILFRERRNLISHTYDANKAAIVFSIVPNFLDETRLLLEAMRLRIASAK